MASIVDTKAVSLRKGNHSENMAFTGVQGETVADLGYEDLNGNLGTDSNTTLRLHNGITKGGIPMARADLLNVSSELLAENRQQINDKNLAYADLSNIEKTEAAGVQNKIKTTMMTYGLAEEASVKRRLDNKVNLNTDNLNTSYLVSNEIHDGLNGNKPLAYKDTSNINTADLVNSDYHNGTPEGNKPLAYADVSNIDTTNLTTSEETRPASMFGPTLATNTLDNIDTTNLTIIESDRPSSMNGPVLAKNDLSNVSDDVLERIIDKPLFNIERTTNKDSVIDVNQIQPGRYPETQAVAAYVKEMFDNNTNFANVTLTNISDWDSLFYDQETPIVEYSGSISSSTPGFLKDDTFITNILLKDDQKGYLCVVIDSVDENGSIQSISLKQNTGYKNIASDYILKITSSTNNNAMFTLNSTYIEENVYRYEINEIIDGGNGFEIDKDYIVQNSNDKKLNIMYKPLCIIVSNVNEDGTILSVDFEPKYGITNISENVNITSEDSSAQIYITSHLYNENGGAGVLKTDLTNLQGMSNEDKEIELDANWRIRHDEQIPSLSETTIPSKQDYTIATNGNVWRALKSIQSATDHTPNVIFNTKFIPGTHPTDTTTLFDIEEEGNFVVNAYGRSNLAHKTKYVLFPNHQYSLDIHVSNHQYNYNFTTGESGTESTYEFSTALITFNTNVQDTYIRTVDTEGEENTYHIDETGNCTFVAIRNIDWVIHKQGYSSVSGSISIADGDQTINVTLEEESESI